MTSGFVRPELRLGGCGNKNRVPETCAEAKSNMEESYNDAGDNSGQQIESSDEYDPAQDVQAVPLPAVDPPNNASQPIPTHTNLFTVSSATGDDTAQTQYSTVKSPTSADDPNNSRLAEDLHSPTSTVIKTRLPHDKIGLLEDRIKDDEKGDLDAWMSLIGEYRKRGKVDDVRKVYKRFFDVFPQAVSCCPQHCGRLR